MIYYIGALELEKGVCSCKLHTPLLHLHLNQIAEAYR